MFNSGEVALCSGLNESRLSVIEISVSAEIIITNDQSLRYF